ncbi:Endonuclease/exonuclease/phosphatase [Sporodiniella umbellata]|nr:Endonuclease/exonuclease/phosphatase [Sporodiniella umbellata]
METNTEAYIRYDPTKENAWVQGVIDVLNEGEATYVKVASKQLVTLLLIVVAKKKHVRFISESQVTWAGVGLMNMMGNKGGIAVRLRFHDSYLCFVTSHLAALTEKTEKRNQDFLELSKRLLFSHTPNRLTQYVSYFWNHGEEGVSFLENHGVLRDWRVEASIYHSDVLLWSGDLNYRINQNESVIKHWLREQRLDVLLAYDQLSIEQRAGRTFPMFSEGQITFPPTYKYDPGTHHYDTSEKRRAPSWTDRVLWKKERATAGTHLQLIDYDHCPVLTVSDHKPVRALMTLRVRKIDSRLLEKTQAALVQQLEEQKKDVQPRGRISSSFVDFEGVQFLEYKEKTLLLENTGQVMVLFRFLPNPTQTRPLPGWLTVSPMSGVLAPGESIVLRFELMVDPTLSTPLNLGYEELEETLILRLENASDFFICVSGHYQPTCFGVPLTLLATLSLPVCAEAENNLALKKDGPPPVPLSPPVDLPQELSKIMNFLWNTNMFQIPSLFLDHGDLPTSTLIRHCLDHGHPLDTTLFDPLEGTLDELDLEPSLDELDLEPSLDELDLEPSLEREAKSANAMIDVLIAFLECLPDPVIPTDLYERALEASLSVEAIQNLKESLPAFHEKVLSNLTMFLRHAIDLAPVSVQKKREAKIIEIFTVLLRPPLDFKERNPVVAKEKREDFISQLLKSLK